MQLYGIHTGEPFNRWLTAISVVWVLLISFVSIGLSELTISATHRFVDDT